MKPKLVVLVVALLLLAMVPALVMAQGRAKPAQTGTVVLDFSQAIGPQLDAQMGVSSKTGNPRSLGMIQLAPRTGSNIQPNAVYALLNDGFEAPWAATNWAFGELGLSPVGWDATSYMSRFGDQSLYSAGYNNDPFVNPYYDNDMFSLAFYSMDLQGAKRAQVRFQYKSDTEYYFDTFYWCASADGVTFYCEYFTGSTNDKWRLVKRDSKTDPILKSMLGSPFAYYGFIFESDFSITDRGTFVDPLRVRVWGP